MIKELGKFHTLANYLSLSRIALLVPIFLMMSKIPEGYQYRLYTLLLMSVAFITDMLDGYVARKFNQITEWGKVIDPFADKLNLGVIVINLYLIDELSVFMFWLIILRDLSIFSGSIVVSKIIGRVLPSNFLGKITMVIIGAYLVLIIAGISRGSTFYNIGHYTVVLFSFLSLIGYGIRGIESVRWYKKNGSV